MRGRLATRTHRTFAQECESYRGVRYTVQITTGTDESTGQWWARVEGQHTYTFERGDTEKAAISQALIVFWPEDDEKQAQPDE